LINAYAVRELSLRNAPARQVALVFRGEDPRDRRIAAIRGALSEAYAQTAWRQGAAPHQPPGPSRSDAGL